MKKEVKLALLILSVVVLIFFLLKITKQEKTTYKIEYEKAVLKIEQEKYKGDYYINIITDKFNYPLIVKEVKSSSNKIVKKVYYYKDDDYECIYPIIESSKSYDVICSKEDIIYNYHSIEGIDDDLDSFVNTIGEYDINLFNDNVDKNTVVSGVKWYTGNSIDKKVFITSYNGLITPSKEIKIFDADIYENKISTFVDKYYIIADYNQKYEFNAFYVINLENQEVFSLKSKYDISFDSYIQGVVDGIVYLYDIDNEIQYKIDIKESSIKVISTRDDVKYFSNSKWQNISKSKANKELLFDYSTLDNDFSSYDKVVKTENYYYLFKQNNNQYRLYKVNKNDLNKLFYISLIPTLDVTINDDFIYYIYENKLYFYSDDIGLKSILEDNELEFNDTIKYYIY